MSELTMTSTKIGQSRRYNGGVSRYRVEVTMFAENVTVPSVRARIERSIDALFPDEPSHPGGSSHKSGLSFLGIVRVEERPSNRIDGKPHEYGVGAWEFDYVHFGCD